MKDEHGPWMMERFPTLYRREPSGAWAVNRTGTLREPVWSTATADENRLLDERERMNQLNMLAPLAPIRPLP